MLKKDRFLDYTTSVTVVKDQTATINAKLEPGSFFEDFNDGVADYWILIIGHNPTFWYVKDGKLTHRDGELPPPSACPFAWYSLNGYAKYKNFAFQADMRSEKGQCMALRMVSDRCHSDCYLFCVRQPSKEWSFYVYSSPSLHLITGVAGVPAIKYYPDWNTVKVVASGSNFKFYVNDTYVGEINDISFASGYVGFYAKNMDVLFEIDNVRLDVLQSGSDNSASKFWILSNPENAFTRVVSKKEFKKERNF